MIKYKVKQATVFESALFRTTSTVVETDDMVLVTDPNWLPQEVYAIRQYVEERRNGRQVFLLFTHSDYDHIIGYKAMPEVQAIASQAFVENTEKEAVIEQILQFDDDYYIQRDYEIQYPEVDILVKQDGQIFEFGQTRMTFYLAPGHNRDGIFTVVEDLANPSLGAVWLAGDYLCNIEFPYIYFSSHEYEKTLAKTETILSKHQIRLMVPGHGDVATTTEEILARKQDALAYIHQLRSHLQNNTTFDVEKLWRQYHFPRLMKKFHEGNVALMEKELGV